MACNAWKEPLDFRIPVSPTGRPWRRIIDTAPISPEDIVAEGKGPVIAANSGYRVGAHSLLVLLTEG